MMVIETRWRSLFAKANATRWQRLRFALCAYGTKIDLQQVLYFTVSTLVKSVGCALSLH